MTTESFFRVNSLILINEAGGVEYFPIAVNIDGVIIREKGGAC
jgi:hypothetical protein